MQYSGVIRKMKIWSRFWKSSKKPGKQRKYRYNAPNHIRRKFMSAHLAKDLIKKYSRRGIPIKVGDTVKILRGEYKGKAGKVEKVDTRKQRVYVEKISVLKKDGTAVPLGVHPSNVMITNLKTDDKLRFGRSLE